jgi:outer membrane protein TolC
VDVEPTSEPAEVREAGVEVERAVEAALGNNPELQALRLTATNAELDLADARHQLLPNLSASGSYGLTGLETRDPDDPAGPFTAAGNLFNGEARNWSLGLNLTAPLGNRADRGLHAQRVAAAQQAGLGLKARELGLAQEVRAAAASLDTARAQLDLMGSNLALAEQTLAAERALADAGRSLQRDVLEAIRNVDEARVNLEKARADYLLAIIELERLKGSL